LGSNHIGHYSAGRKREFVGQVKAIDSRRYQVVRIAAVEVETEALPFRA
jgi:hypothetical protein